MKPPVPEDEAERLEELRAARILDTTTDPKFERIVQIVADLMDTPIALVSLVDEDRQWFKARLGLDVQETHRDMAFCAWAIVDDTPFVVEDATQDTRFRDNPLVQGDPNIRFYAGAPLVTQTGRRLGTVCAIDRRPRQVSKVQLEKLRHLAAMATDMIELHRDMLTIRDLMDQARTEASQRALFLSSFSHELRTPLGQIMGFAELIQTETAGPEGQARSVDYAGIIRNSAQELFQLLDGIIKLERATMGGALDVQAVGIADVARSVLRSFQGTAAQRRQVLRLGDAPEDLVAVANEGAVRQIAINLVSNAVKYSPEGSEVTVAILREGDGRVALEVTDNGPGMPDDIIAGIGRPFLQASDRNRRRQDGIGLGLRICGQLARAMDSELRFERPPGGGTRARLLMPGLAGGSGSGQVER
ncbi:MAG: GAF domain-containing sensor histidine kinase [Pseudomonadota bacterium]|nr:GAF domain-containing sensor histidine kinase [Pseudomonadota bacterium]